MDTGDFDITGGLAPSFCLLLRCLFTVSNDPNVRLHTRFPGLGVGVLLYQFRTLVCITASQDVAAQAFVSAIMRPDRLQGFLGVVFPDASFLVHAAAVYDMGPRGQPADFSSPLFLARLNPGGLPHGCVVRGLLLRHTLVLAPLDRDSDDSLLASEVRVLRRGISRALRDRRLPLTCHLLFERPPRGSAARSSGSRGAPAEIGTVDLEWDIGGEHADEPTMGLISRMGPSMFWRSSRSTRYYNRHHPGWATTPPSSTDEDEWG